MPAKESRRGAPLNTNTRRGHRQHACSGPTSLLIMPSNYVIMGTLFAPALIVFDVVLGARRPAWQSENAYENKRKTSNMKIFAEGHLHYHPGQCLTVPERRADASGMQAGSPCTCVPMSIWCENTPEPLPTHPPYVSALGLWVGAPSGKTASATAPVAISRTYRVTSELCVF